MTEKTQRESSSYNEIWLMPLHQRVWMGLRRWVLIAGAGWAGIFLLPTLLPFPGLWSEAETVQPLPIEAPDLGPVTPRPPELVPVQPSRVVTMPAPKLVPAAKPKPVAKPKAKVQPAKAAAEPKPAPGAQPGVASYYSSSLEGNPTASGEPYDPDELTAAHRTLPMGTRLRVTNVRNGKSVVVRVNDRGPFVGKRVIDLSRAAAKKIGMIRSGTARVQLEKIPKGA